MITVEEVYYCPYCRRKVNPRVIMRLSGSEEFCCPSCKRVIEVFYKDKR